MAGIRWPMTLKPLRGAEPPKVEPRFCSPTHQLGGDVLGEAHGGDAIRADHQQCDDDVDKGQPVGEVGPAAEASVSSAVT